MIPGWGLNLWLYFFSETKKLEKGGAYSQQNISFALQVRWNACYALGNLFRNHCLPIGSAPWTVICQYARFSG